MGNFIFVRQFRYPVSTAYMHILESYRACIYYGEFAQIEMNFFYKWQVNGIFDIIKKELPLPIPIHR